MHYNLLNKALSTISRKNNKWVSLKGHYYNLLGTIFKSNQRYVDRPDLCKIENRLNSISKSIYGLIILHDKVKYLNNLEMETSLSKSDWLSYSYLDMEYFYITLRGVFNYISEILVITSKYPKQNLPDNDGISFTKMQNWCISKKSEKAKFPQDIEKFYIDCNWYNDVKSIRDLLIHHGKKIYPLINFEDDDTLFELNKEFKKYIPKEVWETEYSASFDKHSALYFGYLIGYLENISEFLLKEIDMPNPIVVTQQFTSRQARIFDEIQSLAQARAPNDEPKQS